MKFAPGDEPYIYDLVVKGLPLKEIAHIHNMSYENAWEQLLDEMNISLDNMYDIEKNMESYERILTQLNWNENIIITSAFNGVQ